MSLPQKQDYTIDDIYALPDGQRAELIDGQMYMMAPPKTIHQKNIRRFVCCHLSVYQSPKRSL